MVKFTHIVFLVANKFILLEVKMIYIAPITIAILLIIIGNCIIAFGKSKILNLSHIILSSIFSIVGIVGIIITRTQFIKRLNKNAIIRSFENDFVTWAIEKFDHFAVISIISICTIIILFLLYFCLSKNKSGFLWNNTTVIIVSIMIINFISGLWYSLGTINKLFDVAGHISNLTAYEFFALHIPLLVKRIIMTKKKMLI